MKVFHAAILIDSSRLDKNKEDFLYPDNEEVTGVLLFGEDDERIGSCIFFSKNFGQKLNHPFEEESKARYRRIWEKVEDFSGYWYFSYAYKIDPVPFSQNNKVNEGGRIKILYIYSPYLECKYDILGEQIVS